MKLICFCLLCVILVTPPSDLISQVNNDSRPELRKDPVKKENIQLEESIKELSSIRECFQKAGFDLEKIEFEFQFKDFRDYHLAVLHFQRVITVLKLKARVYGRWTDTPPSKRRHQVEIPIDVNLWKLGSSSRFFRWCEKEKANRSWKESLWRNRYWKNTKFKKIARSQRLAGRIKIPKEVDPKKGFEFDFGVDLEFDGTDRELDQNTVHVFEIKESKKVRTIKKGWMITFQEPVWRIRANRGRQTVGVLGQFGFINQETSLALRNMISDWEEFESKQAKKRIKKRQPKLQKEKFLEGK